ncbi:MAG: c-type cytochrome [Halobacteriovoraceae bacterium]|nr:c-type cytochrome [Halobacteriovoraceae bacterium]
MKSCYTLLLLLSSTLIFVSCNESGFKTGRTFIGGKKISAATLSKGKQIYLEYCSACHGLNGDGNGPAAKGSVPPPRNFTQGLYKFGLVQDGALPTDEDFIRIIQGGLKGTAMLKWDISHDQAFAVVQYIKTFAPQVWEGEDSEVGTPIELSNDPYTLARKEAAIEKGKEVFHITASCQTCHRAYVSHNELSNLNKKVNGEGMDDFSDDLYQSKLQTSEYYFYDSKERVAQYIPPDFTWHDIRSASTVKDIAYRVAAGVAGTGMPAWKGTITDDEIWAVAYYVKSLTELKGNLKARAAFLERIEEGNRTAKGLSKENKGIKVGSSN